jgi:hypothetical protein
MHKEDAKVREKESFGQLGLMNGIVAGTASYADDTHIQNKVYIRTNDSYG